MAIAMVEAKRLAKANRALHDEIEDRRAVLDARAEAESAAQERLRRQVYDDVLVPFRDVFVSLKNIDLAELDAVTPARSELPRIELQAVRLSALGTVGALAGGLASGAGAGAGTFTAVGAFAAASTGTPIAALSGAAASNATLAFLGGGSLAAGGGGVAAGTLVFGGLVAVPVLVVGFGYVTWRGRSAARTQREVGAALEQAVTELVPAEERLTAVLTRSAQSRAVLDALRSESVERLPELARLVDHDPDYSRYTGGQREQVATMVGLVTTAVAVMGTALADDTGAVTELSAQVLADARRRLDDLSTEAAGNAT